MHRSLGNIELRGQAIIAGYSRSGEPLANYDSSYFCVLFLPLLPLHLLSPTITLPLNYSSTFDQRLPPVRLSNGAAHVRDPAGLQDTVLATMKRWVKVFVRITVVATA